MDKFFLKYDKLLLKKFFTKNLTFKFFFFKKCIIINFEIRLL